MVPEIKICDVTLRDGMQVLNRHASVALDERVALFEALQRSGLPYLEVGSFVNPHVVESMADTPELLAAIRPVEGQQLAALVPRLDYYERFREAPYLDTVALFVSASEGYSRKNTRMTVEEAVQAALEVAAAARRDGYRLRAYLSCAFRDLTDGSEADPAVVVDLCRRFVDARCETVALSDTDGKATPRDLERIAGACLQALGPDPIGVHLHDRNGLGITNAFVAFQLGVRTFDASIGGIGGNNAIQNAVGNLATEELVNLFAGIKKETGVDLEALEGAQRLVYRMATEVGDPIPPSKILFENVVRPELGDEAPPAAQKKRLRSEARRS